VAETGRNRYWVIAIVSSLRSLSSPFRHPGRDIVPACRSRLFYRRSRKSRVISISRAVTNPASTGFSAETPSDRLNSIAGGITANGKPDSFGTEYSRVTARGHAKNQYHRAEAWLLEALPGMADQSESHIEYRAEKRFLPQCRRIDQS